MAIYQNRICRECGRPFEGGPRAWYCPDCRAERRHQQHLKAEQRRRTGKVTRPIGSTDHCVVCGEQYIVKSARQKYCPKCAKDAVAAIDRRQGLERYHASSDDINLARTPQRREQYREGRPQSKPDMITLHEYAKRHGKSHATVWSLVKSGALTTIQRSGRRIYINANEPYPQDKRVKHGAYIGIREKTKKQ